MSQSSTSFGKARCAGSRTGEAPSTGSQSRLVPAGAAAEMGELDHHLAVMLVAVVGKLPQPRHDLVAIGVQIAEGGRDCRATTIAEPAVMVSAMPPFAFSA